MLVTLKPVTELIIIVYSSVQIFKEKYFFETWCTKFASFYIGMCTLFFCTLWSKNAGSPALTSYIYIEYKRKFTCTKQFAVGL